MSRVKPVTVKPPKTYSGYMQRATGVAPTCKIVNPAPHMRGKGER